MENPLKKIEELALILPGKDAKSVKDFIDKRDFQSVLEIVESDIYKAGKNRKQDELLDDYSVALEELKGELLTYMSYLNLPYDSYNYDIY